MEERIWRQEVHATERDSYIVLLHLYTLTELAPVLCLAADRLVRDLGLPESRAEKIVRGLLDSEYVEYCGSGQGLVLTAKGVRYIEREAGRRRSVRLMS